jgi:hypothetical protein
MAGLRRDAAAMIRHNLAAAVLAMLLLPASAAAHAPSVTNEIASSPDEAIVLEDPTLSRAIGAVLDTPGEVDWYRMDLEAGDPLVVGMTAPDAEGAVASTFVLLGPGLPDVALSDAAVQGLAERVSAGGALAFRPVADPPLEVHAGLGFINYGTLRLEAPESGTYWVAVSAVDANETGKYVFAPGDREEFGIDALGGMGDLLGFSNAPWPPSDAASGGSD